MRFIENSLSAIIGLCLVVVCVLFIGNCFGGQARQHIVKTFQSNTVGLEREISVYDYTGKRIEYWRGKTTIDTSHGDVDFILNGKRNVVRGGIVIIKEVDNDD
jgi:hypothetical protein